MLLLQEELIAAVKTRAENDALISAVLMYGSFTQDAGDQFSDVEFYVFVDDVAFSALNTAAWIAGVSPVYICFYNQYGTEVAIFKNLIRGEFHFLSQSKMNVIKSFTPIGWVPDVKSMCLYDETGSLRRYLDELQVNAAAVKRGSTESIEHAFNNCLNLLLMGVNVLRRGETARAWDTLAQAQSFYLQLVRLDENVTHHWLNPLKGLEKEISTPAYQRFLKGTAGLYTQDIGRAYLELGFNLKDISGKLKTKFIFDFNAELLEILIETKLKM